MGGWLPAFLLGMASAVVVETGLGLLLFVSPGLLPALTGLLSIALGAFALGLASIRRFPGEGLGLRWRWLLTALSLAAAAVLSLGWTFQGGGAPASALGRGIRMTLLLALPLYGLGACSGAVARIGPGPRHASAAAAGGAVGVLVLGLVLLPRFEPFSVYLFCLLCVALAALATTGVDRRRARAGLPLPPPGRDPWTLETLGS